MSEYLKALIEAAKSVRKSLQEYDQDEHASGEIFYCEMMSESIDLLSDAVKEYEESLKESKPTPAIDDALNDDTIAQTFGPIIPFDCFDLAVEGGKTVTCDFFSVPDEAPMRLIGIAGPARAGKDTLFNHMLDNLSDDWTRSSFADPIKKMLETIGLSCKDETKHMTSIDYNVTPRHAMQTLGTEWGRHLIDGDIWVKAFARLNAGKCVIVPDVRFENEADLVREHGVLIHLVGRGGIEGDHVSENPIEFKPGDIVIDNSRDLAWLHNQVDCNYILSEFIAEVGE